MRLLILVLLLLVAAGSPALAATFVVTKEADDDGPCTVDDCALREAVLAANPLPGLDRIELPTGVYQLSLTGPVEENLSLTGDLDVIDALEIAGDPSALPTIIGDGTDRVIQSLGPHTLSLSHLIITGGSAESSGGGVRVSAGNLILRSSIVIGNSTLLDGGGVFVGPGTSLIADTAIVGNTAASQGGGLHVTTFSAFDFVDTVNVTISGNEAQAGGGIYVFGGGNVTITNTTITDNIGEIPFSDALVGDTANRLTFRNVLVVNNACGYISSIPQSNGHNMEGPTATCFVPGDGDAMGVPDIMLGPLEDNGGPTPTHALLPGSPAIDAALNTDCPGTDQRGVARPIDGDGDGTAVCDIGAFEVQGATVLGIPTMNATGRFLLGALLLAVAASRLRRVAAARRG